MYKILCDGYPLYDPRDDELVLTNKRCKIGSNVCGEASFVIHPTHPHYDKLKKLKSVFEIQQDGDVIFRGRMTDDSRDFDNMKAVDLEGAMAYLNDSVIRPFDFPDGFPDLPSTGNVVEYFFRWIIEQHNAQVQPFQRFKVGNVTVSDPNNYITRSNSDYSSAWETMKDKLFGSSLGGYLCIRYETDGNYLDYLADYVDGEGNQIINGQVIRFGENLLDIQKDSDAKQTYSAIIPIGAKEGESSVLTLRGLPDGDVTDDIVKDGDVLYSRSAVAEYGWICAPVDETTWEDVGIATNLRSRGVDFLQQSSGFFETITLTAMDLHLTESAIEAFRIYKYVAAVSSPHGTSGIYPLSELEIDMDNLQNTKITVGETKGGLTDKTSSTAQKINEIRKTYTPKSEMITEVSQLDDKISLVVTESVGGNEINSASIIAAINNDESSVTINASKINLTAYAKTSDVSTIASNAAAAEIEGITLTATAGDGKSTLKLYHDGLEVDSAEIKFNGVVTFNDLSGTMSTKINGGNIATKTITAEQLNVDSLAVKNVVYYNDNYPYSIVSSSLAGQWATIEFGLNEHTNTSTNLVAVYGDYVWLAQSENNSNQIWFDFLYQEIKPSPASSWYLGTESNRFAGISTDMFWLYDGDNAIALWTDGANLMVTSGGRGYYVPMEPT